MTAHLATGALAVTLVLASCGGTGSVSGDGEDDVLGDATDAVDVLGDVDDDDEPYLPGWIGSPCTSETDCSYAESTCLAEAPDGMCSLACDLYCPDRDGYPETFCVDAGSLPPEAPGFDEGACFSRCDYGFFPGTGCREGYGCVEVPRAGEPSTVRFACIPGEESPPLSECQLMLASMGVSFEPTTHSPESPDTHPELTCVIEDPVIVHPPIHGVDVTSPWGETPNMLAACSMALSLVMTVDDVAEYGVTTFYHMGTYNCRVIAGTDRLSRHAYGDALDISGFDFEDGTSCTLVDDWEHDTETPVTPCGSFMYEAAHRWFDGYYWNTILTPNYNEAHDDHFHVDLTPDRHFMEALPGSGRYIGPAPYAD
ncbi:MAG: extensin family protein [Deltaproteobacteria bacterium]|nr:extensin family protein [Deltaproteobacteria bacterium]